MRQKILIFLLAVVFAFSQTTMVYAKARSGGVSSGSRSISRSSGGYSGSSSSKSIGGSSKSSGSSSAKSSSSGYSGSSSSRSVPDSYSSGGSSSSSSSGYSGSSSSGKSSGSASGGVSGSASSGQKSTGSTSKVTSKTDTLKNSYMQEQYKKQVSQNNYSDYKQKLNDEQKKSYESSFNKSYNVNNRMSFEDAMRTRPQRISTFNTRPVIVNVNPGYFGGPFSYGYGFVGPWDLWFLMRASDLFWYHHWHDILPYRDRFQESQFREMEARIAKLEAQNIARDQNYLEPGVDPDLQFSSDYQEKNVDKLYYTDKYVKPVSNPIPTLIVIIIIAGVLIVVIRKISRPRPRKPWGGSIY